MKIECYDKYQKMWLIIEFEDDEIYVNSSSSSNCYANMAVKFTIHPTKNGDNYAEDPHVKRWSDLEQFTILTYPYAKETSE